MFQQGAPGAAASWAGLDEGTAAAVQRVWLAVAEASGLAKVRMAAHLPAAAASDRRLVVVRSACAASASPRTAATAPDFNASSMVHNRLAGFFSVMVTKRWRGRPSRSSPWP
jgi:hypothetical protein